MRAKTPTPRIVSETPGHSRFNIGLNLREAERAALIGEMRKRGNHSWEPPTSEVVIESSRSIGHLMQEAPIGKQAIVTKGGS